jgi:hypothetical protein
MKSPQQQKMKIILFDFFFPFYFSPFCQFLKSKFLGGIFANLYMENKVKNQRIVEQILSLIKVIICSIQYQ